MPEYIPSPRQWVRDQVDLYESSGGTKGTTLRDTGLPVIVVTHKGNKTGAIRKSPLMRVKDGDRYILVGSMGGAPSNPVWVYNLRANPAVEIRDLTTVQPMRVREVTDETERARLWALAVAAFASGNVMLLSIGVWAGAEDATRDLLHWVSALIAMPAAGACGDPFEALGTRTGVRSCAC